MQVTIFHKGETVTANEADWQRAADEVVVAARALGAGRVPHREAALRLRRRP